MNENKKEWPKSNVQLANFLGVSVNAIRAHKRRHKKELIEGVDFSSDDLKVPYAPIMTIWFKEGAVKLAHYCRSDKARIFLESEGIQKLHKNSVEGEIIGIIADAVYGITTCKKQYTVEGYRVDLYLKDLNIVVECDEMGHEWKNNYEEMLRQNIIESKLGCTFLRFNPDEKGFRLGNILNKVFKEIIKRHFNASF